MSIELLEPFENIELPIRYTPGLICAVKLKALLHNFIRFENLFIQVRVDERRGREGVECSLNPYFKIILNSYFLRLNIPIMRYNTYRLIHIK